MALEVVGSAVLRAVVPSLGKLLIHEWGLKKKARDGLRSLETELKHMQAVLDNVSGVPPDQLDPQVKLWADEVRELSHTIETRLHSFMVRIKSTKGTLLSTPIKVKINHEIATYTEEIMIKVKEVSERHGRYHDRGSPKTTPASKVDPRILFLDAKESDLVGIAKAIHELTMMLCKGDHVSIVGMGGLGKTTLAQVVYNKMKGEEEFDCQAFVRIGQSAGPEKVLEDIIYELQIEIRGHARDQGQLIRQLQESLVDKRCLIVADDIWDEETWKLIKCVFGNSAGSKIITTTRKLKVAIEVGGIYKINPLCHANSKELLNTKIFGNEAKSQDTEFARLADKILSKCHGVPLAIIAIASLLAKKGREEWSNIYDSIGFGKHEKDGVVDDIRRILSFSYYDLPYHLRRCFLYLSLFPEDHWIEKNMLIWRWVAEGLVPGRDESREKLFELGETYLNELIDRSMIQLAMNPHDLGHGGFRIHDIMLDLIRNLSSSENENFSTVVGKKQGNTCVTSTIHRLAIHEKILGQNQNTSLEVGEVRSFYCSKCLGSSLPPLSKFSGLRVVDLVGCDLSVGDCKLEHLGKLAGLEYIGLVGTPIAELPKNIRDLQFLQTLDVTATGIGELPSFIEGLKKLRCLRAGKGTRMLGKVGELTSLEELCLYSVDKSPDFGTELRKLKELRVLVIHFDNMKKDMLEPLVESLSFLKKLQVLQIWSDQKCRKILLHCWESSVPYPELRQLLLFGIILPMPMPWIHHLCVPKLSKLLLQVETLEARHLETLGQMSSLHSLYLHSEDDRYRLSYTAGKHEFKVLAYLNTNIEMVCGDGAMPMIQELEVGGIRVGIDVGLRGNMPLLQRATYHLDCNGCGPVEVHKAEEELTKAGEVHPNRPALSIRKWNTLGMEMLQRNAESLSLNPDFVKAVHGGDLPSFLASPGLLNKLMEAALQHPTVLTRKSPTLAVRDPTATDSTTSTSQEPSRNSKGETKFTTHDSEDWFDFRWLSDVVRQSGALLGTDPDVPFNMFIKKMANPPVRKKIEESPEFIAMVHKIMQNKDEPFPSGPEVSRVLQLMIPEMCSNMQELIMNMPRINAGYGVLSQMVLVLAFDRLDQEQDGKRLRLDVDRFFASLDSTIADTLMNTIKMYMKNPEVVGCLNSMTQNKTAKNSDPEVDTSGVLSWLNSPDGLDFLSFEAARLGMGPVAFGRIWKKYMLNPEMIAAIGSAVHKNDSSGVERQMKQLMVPDIRNYFAEQYMDGPFSRPPPPPKLDIAGFMLSWFNSPGWAALVAKGAAKFKMDPIAHESVMKKCMLNPKVMAAMGSAVQNGDSSEFDRLIMQLAQSEFRNYFAKQDMDGPSSRPRCAGGGQTDASSTSAPPLVSSGQYDENFSRMPDVQQALVGGGQSTSKGRSGAESFEVDAKGTPADPKKHRSEKTASAGIRREPPPPPKVDTNSMFSWLNTPDGAAFLKEGATLFGIDPEVHGKLDKCMLNPEIIASINSMMQNVNFSGIKEHITPSSMPQHSNSGRGANTANGMFSGLLDNPAFGSIMANLAAQPGFRDAVASCASVMQGMAAPPPPESSAQDGEKFSRMLKQVLPAVQQTLAAAGQPSSKVNADSVLSHEGPADASGMLSSSLSSEPALEAQSGTMGATVASNYVSEAQSRQDCENTTIFNLNELLATLEKDSIDAASSGQPSSAQLDDVGNEEGDNT